MSKLLEKSVNLSFTFLDAIDLEELGKTYAHFSFIWKKKKLISFGRNFPRKESAKALYFARRFGQQKIQKYPFIHSEIDAISKAWGKVQLGSSHVLINTRVNRDGTLGISKPCDQCQLVLDSIGFKEILWTKKEIII